MKVLVDVERCRNTVEETQLQFLASAGSQQARSVTWDAGSGERRWDVVAVDLLGEFSPAVACPVDDSGGGVSWLVHGGTGGIRLRREGSGPFDLEDGSQVGLPYLLLGPGDVELS